MDDEIVLSRIKEGDSVTIYSILDGKYGDTQICGILKSIVYLPTGEPIFEFKHIPGTFQIGTEDWMFGVLYHTPCEKFKFEEPGTVGNAEVTIGGKRIRTDGVWTRGGDFAALDAGRCWWAGDVTDFKPALLVYEDWNSRERMRTAIRAVGIARVGVLFGLPTTETFVDAVFMALRGETWKPEEEE